MLGDAEAPEDRRLARLAVDVRGALEVGGGDPADALHVGRRVVGEQVLERRPALGAPVDERQVEQAVARGDVGEAEHDRGVGARPWAEVQRGVVGQLDPARVDRDEPQAAQRRLLDARADDRVALGRVGADEDRRARVLDVVEAAGRARQAERLAQRPRGGGVADARAVVDVVRADRGAHEPLHDVAVLVRRARRGQAGDRVGPGLGADARDLADDPRDRLVPCRRAQLAAALVAHERRAQAVALAREAVREAALQAGVALVRRPVERRADRHDAPIDGVGLQPAADAAVAARGGDLAVESLGGDGHRCSVCA